MKPIRPADAKSPLWKRAVVGASVVAAAVPAFADSGVTTAVDTNATYTNGKAAVGAQLKATGAVVGNASSTLTVDPGKTETLSGAALLQAFASKEGRVTLGADGTVTHTDGKGMKGIVGKYALKAMGQANIGDGGKLKIDALRDTHGDLGGAVTAVVPVGDGFGLQIDLANKPAPTPPGGDPKKDYRVRAGGFMPSVKAGADGFAVVASASAAYTFTGALRDGTGFAPLPLSREAVGLLAPGSAVTFEVVGKAAATVSGAAPLGGPFAVHASAKGALAGTGRYGVRVVDMNTAEIAVTATSMQSLRADAGITFGASGFIQPLVQKAVWDRVAGQVAKYATAGIEGSAQTVFNGEDGTVFTFDMRNDRAAAAFAALIHEPLSDDTRTQIWQLANDSSSGVKGTRDRAALEDFDGDLRLIAAGRTLASYETSTSFGEKTHWVAGEEPTRETTGSSKLAVSGPLAKYTIGNKTVEVGAVQKLQRVPHAVFEAALDIIAPGVDATTGTAVWAASPADKAAMITLFTNAHIKNGAVHVYDERDPQATLAAAQVLAPDAELNGKTITGESMHFDALKSLLMGASLKSSGTNLIVRDARLERGISYDLSSEQYFMCPKTVRGFFTYADLVGGEPVAGNTTSADGWKNCTKHVRLVIGEEGVAAIKRAMKNPEKVASTYDALHVLMTQRSLPKSGPAKDTLDRYVYVQQTGADETELASLRSAYWRLTRQDIGSDARDAVKRTQTLALLADFRDAMTLGSAAHVLRDIHVFGSRMGSALLVELAGDVNVHIEAMQMQDTRGHKAEFVEPAARH